MILSTACISGFRVKINSKEIYVAPGGSIDHLPEDIIADLIASGLAGEPEAEIEEAE